MGGMGILFRLSLVTLGKLFGQRRTVERLRNHAVHYLRNPGSDVQFPHQSVSMLLPKSKSCCQGSTFVSANVPG